MEEDETAHYEYVNTINESLECPICRTAFVEPVLTPCQHIFCSACIYRALALSPTCPIDRQSLAASELVSAPRIVHRMVEELEVVCGGCAKTMERGLLKGHEVDCNRKGKGKEKEAAAATTPCALCKEDLNAVAMTSHASACPSVPVICRHCAAPLTRSTLPAHLHSACPLVPLPCPHSIHGCSIRVPRTALAEHVELTCAFEPLKTFFTAYQDRVQGLEQERDGLLRRVGSLEDGMRDLRTAFEGVKATLGDLYVSPATSPDYTASKPSPTPLSPPSSPPLPHVPSQPLPTLLSTLSTSLGTVQTSLSALDLRHSTETRLISEDVQTLRGGVHHLRMQLHWVLAELQAGRTRSHSMGSGISPGGGDGGESNSDEEGHLPIPGMGGMGRRFFGPQPMPIGMPLSGMLPPGMGMPGQQMGGGMARSPPFLGHIGAPYGSAERERYGGGMKL